MFFLLRLTNTRWSDIPDIDSQNHHQGSQIGVYLSSDFTSFFLREGDFLSYPIEEFPALHQVQDHEQTFPKSEAEK